MAILRQLGLEGRDFVEGAASFRNYAGQMRYKHPWCTKSGASTILLLPSLEGGLFYLDLLAHFHDVMSQLAMQTLAVGCQSSLRFGMRSPGRFVPLALFPAQTRFPVLLDASFL